MFLWEVLGGRLEAEGAIVLLGHFKDAYGVSVGQPGDKRPSGETQRVRGAGFN